MPVAFSKAATIGRHHSSCTVQYSTSSPCAEAVSGAASKAAAVSQRVRCNARVVMSLSPSSVLSSKQGNAGQLRQRPGQRGVRGEDRIAAEQAVAGEEVVDAPAGLGHQQQPGGTVPAVDVQLDIALDAARS